MISKNEQTNKQAKKKKTTKKQTNKFFAFQMEFHISVWGLPSRQWDHEKLLLSNCLTRKFQTTGIVWIVESLCLEWNFIFKELVFRQPHCVVTYAKEPSESLNEGVMASKSQYRTWDRKII